MMPHRPNLPMQRAMLPNHNNMPDMSNNMSGMQPVPGQQVPMPQQQQGPRPSSIPSGMVPQTQLGPPKPVQQQQPNPIPPSESPDPMLRAKVLLPQLKESLVTLMSVASQSFEVNNHVDDIKKVSDVGRRKYEKCLEHFYSLCDQLELLLNLAYQQLNGMMQCVKYTPHLATINIKDGNAPSLYENYTVTIDQQIRFAKDMYGVLQSCCDKLFDHKTNFPLS